MAMPPPKPDNMHPGIGRDGAQKSSKAVGLDAELFLQSIVHGLRVGLAAGRFHDLADEPAEHGGLRLHLLDLVGIGGDDRVDGLFDGTRIGDLF